MKMRSSIALIVYLVLAIFVFCSSASAAVWESDATTELTGIRTSPVSSGIDATDGWDNGGFVLSWNIIEDSGIWTYEYTVNVTRKDPSHFILEVTEDGNPFNIFEGTDVEIEGPQTWTEHPVSNPLMPNDIWD